MGVQRVYERPDGRLWAAASGGVAIFDGHRWELIALGSPAQSLDFLSDGRVLVGSYGDVGIIEPDLANGNLSYRSLAGIPTKRPISEDVWGLYGDSSRFLIVASQVLYWGDDNSLSGEGGLDYEDFENSRRLIPNRVGSEVYIHQRHPDGGLLKWTLGSQSGPKLIVPESKLDSGIMTVIPDGSGFLAFSLQGKVYRFKSGDDIEEIASYNVKNQVWRVVRHNDGYLAQTPSGVVELDSEFSIKQTFSADLFDGKRLLSIEAASDGGYWVSTWGGGLFYFLPDLTIVNELAWAISGSEDKKVISTKSGLLIHEDGDWSRLDTDAEVWDAVAVPGGSLMLTETNIRLFDGDEFRRVADWDYQSGTLTLLESDPGAIIALGRKGIFLLRADSDGVVLESSRTGAYWLYADNLVEFYNHADFESGPSVDLWFGTNNMSLWRLTHTGEIPIDLTNVSVVRYDLVSPSGKKASWARPFKIGSSLFVLSSVGLFSYDTAVNSFQFRDVFTSDEMGHWYESLLTAKDNIVWLLLPNRYGEQLVGSKAVRLELEGSSFHRRDFVSKYFDLAAPVRIIHFDETTERLWLGGRSIVVVDPESDVAVPMPLVRSVGVDGEKYKTLSNLVFEHPASRLNIEFSVSTGFEQGNLIYRTRLLPGGDWAESANISAVDYYSLSPGSYEFEIQTIVPGLGASEVATVGFEISRPWHMTTWFLAIKYSVLIVLLAALFWLGRMTLMGRYRRAMSEVEDQEEQVQLAIQSAARSFQLVRHEARAPIDSAKLSLNKLERIDDLPPRARPYIKRTKKSLSFIQTMLNGVFLIPDIEYGKIENDEKETNVHSLAQELYDILRDREGFDRVKFDFPYKIEQIEADVVLIDREKVLQILVQLSLNAFQHCNSLIRCDLTTVHGHKDGGYFEFTIENDGPPVPNGDRGKIFEPFYSTRKEQGGSGIGLYVCAKMVEALSGDLSLEDSKIGGALFRVKIPFSVPVRIGK